MTSLKQAIAAIDQLIDQLQNGSMFIIGSSAAVPVTLPTTEPQQKEVQQQPPASKKKEKKQAEKPPKQSGGGGGGGGAVEGVELFAKAKLCVARVTSVVPHPNSDKLYITQLDIGDGSTRQIVAGLQKHIAIDALLNSLVVVILNLKAARLAGEISEGMILASIEGADGEKVKPLVPDASSSPGDLLSLEGQEVSDKTESYPKQLKGDHWRKIMAGLKVLDSTATFDGIPLVNDKGEKVGAPGFLDNSTIS